MVSVPPLRSAVYEGAVHHHRSEPDHRFSYRLAMPLLDLTEVEQVCSLHPLWSAERPNVVSFRRSDHLGDPAVPLDDAVRDLVEERTGRRPLGPVLLLTHARTWGWLFNPLSVYYCMTDDGPAPAVEAVVLEVTNTPWHERHAYVVEGGSGEHRLDKEMHVSPFFSMDHAYRLRVSEPADELRVELALMRGESPVFEAVLALRRRPLGRAALGRVLWRYPLTTMRVSAGIYWQALKLWVKGAKFHRHPSRRGAVVATTVRS